MNDFLSPIRLQGPTIDECKVKVSPAHSPGDLKCNVEINSSLPSNVRHIDDYYVLNFELQVVVNAFSKDDETANSPILEAKLKLSGAVSVPETIGIPEDHLIQPMQMNAISLYYSSARSYLEMITSLTKIGRFSLPPINPSAYLKSDDDDA